MDGKIKLEDEGLAQVSSLSPLFCCELPWLCLQPMPAKSVEGAVHFTVYKLFLKKRGEIYFFTPLFSSQKTYGKKD